MIFRELKEFCNQLNEEQLSKPVRTVKFNEIERVFAAELSEEILINKEDSEDRGTLEEMKEMWGEDFNMESYRIQAAGIPFLHLEF